MQKLFSLKGTKTTVLYLKPNRLLHMNWKFFSNKSDVNKKKDKKRDGLMP
ncbi:hypothetical protein [Pedobacter steynii]